MNGRPIDVLTETIRRNPIRSQREACAVTARRSIAAFGPVGLDQVRDVAIELASGLFGPAFEGAADAEQDRMIALMEDEYRKCLRRPAEQTEPTAGGRKREAMNDTQSTIVGLKAQDCPGGGWNGMPAELECPTVADCLAHDACGCIYGDAVLHLERLKALEGK